MDHESVTRLEEKLAHQELALATLNEALVAQHKRITELEAQIAALGSRLRSLQEAGPMPSPDDERPPHY